MKIEKMQVVNQDNGELQEAEKLVCGCGCEHFMIFKIGDDDNHMHLQCQDCEENYCALNGNHGKVEIKTSTEIEGFSE